MSKLLRGGIPRKEDGKIDYSWKNHYGFTGLIWLLGILFPPLAVAIRFGIGCDFFINVLLTICGIIPGHLHNWFIQNIRNNDTKARTPKWAIRYGLVDDRPAKKLQKSRAWTGRFNDRLPPSQTVVYDDDGNAHLVEEPDAEIREDTASLHGIKTHKTGLVEPDQWINKDPSQPKIDYSIEPTSERKSKLGVFKRNKSSATPTSGDGRVDDRHRRWSTASSNSSTSLMTPEDPTRTFAPSDSYAHVNNVNSPKSNNSSSEPPRQRREEDIFAHEF